MAFIDEFSELVVKNGQQEKIVDKDKAIIELAIAIMDGGDNPTAEASFTGIVRDGLTIQPDEYGDYTLNLNDLNNSSSFSVIINNTAIGILIPKLGGVQILHSESFWYNYNVDVRINGQFDYEIKLKSIFDSSKIADIYVVKQ